MNQPPLSKLEIELNWEEQQTFASKNRGENILQLDGSGQSGHSPMESLLSSLCGCIGIDLVIILEKMRLELKGLRIHASGERNTESPRYFRSIHLNIHIQGEVPHEKAIRAIELSIEKYCSVLHSLREDLELTHHLEIES